MSVGASTTRDQLERVLDVLLRTTRYLWLCAAITLVGGAIAVGFALTRPHQFESEVVLLYREMIAQSMVQDREVHVAAAALASRYREMLLSRQNLKKVVEELGLYPDVVAGEGSLAAADALRARVTFRDKGSGTFRIAFRGDSPEQAQKVTARLASLLREEESQIRREQARQTLDFLAKEKARADADLLERQRAQAAFLTEHPEFAQDARGGEGAAIRSAATRKPSSDSLSALERQRARIQARLRNPNKPIVTALSARANRAATEARAKAAAREADVARGDLTDKMRRFTQKHPDVVAARNRLEEAERIQRQAANELATLSDSLPSVLIAPFNRTALESELARLESEIASYKSSKSRAAADKSDLVERLVTIEAEWAALDREVEEARARVQGLETKAFTAEITASSEVAEASQLSIIDEAFLPHQPTGRSRKLIALAGVAVFGGLGLLLAIGLALVDDRVFHRRDLETLAIAPVLAVVPAAARRTATRWRWRRQRG